MLFLPTLSRCSRFTRPFLALAILASAAIIIQAEETRGLVKEEPKTGRFVKTEKGYMVPYEATIPGTEIMFAMEPIPGGKFLLGSPASEAKRNADEGPQVEVVVEPFWMGRCEVTWAEYKSYMKMCDVFRKFNELKLRQPTAENASQLVSAPSKLYDPSFTFSVGSKPKQPAITISQFAARQYTKWLSGTTGEIYRLPSEAEWEYAARAGTNTTWFFGNDPKKIGEYAWYFENSNEVTHEVGLKKPNPWGLYDTCGNVAEWTLDEYSAEGYKVAAGKAKPLAAKDAVAWPTKLYPRALRGGTYDSDPEKCRSASRMASNDDDWRADDPNRPQSPWWFTTRAAIGVGFRICRPLAPPSDKDREKYWEADLEDVRDVVKQRVEKEGRGAFGITDPKLSEAVEQLKPK